MSTALHARKVRATVLGLAGVLSAALVSVFVVQPDLVSAAASSVGSATTGGKADYGVALSPTAQSVQQGKSVASTVALTAVNGFASDVTLKVRSLPAGLAATLTASSFSMRAGSQQNTTLSVASARTVPLGTYDVTVDATSGKTVRTSTAKLTVDKTPGAFALSVGPATANVAPGNSAVYQVSLNRTGSYNGLTAVLSATGLPAGATATFNPASTTESSSTLQVDTTASTPDGSYPLTVTARVGDESFTATTQLVVAYSSRTFAISGSTTSAVAPGVDAPIDLVLENPNGRTLDVTNLTVAVTGVRPLAGRSCDVRSYSVVQYSGGYPLSVAGNGSLSLAGIDPALKPALRIGGDSNQDGCKGATVELTYSGAGSGS